MAGLSIWHVLIFAIVVILLFGTSKLKNIGKDVGGAVKDFKKSDQKLADEMILRAADAAELIFEDGLNKAMNKYNA